jgi:hypothetical protein
MICLLVRKFQCVNRVGQILTQEEVENPDLKEDREVCKYKKGDLCEHTYA